MTELRTVKVYGIPRNYLNVLEEDFLSSKILDSELFNIPGLKSMLHEIANAKSLDSPINHWLNCYKLLDFIGHWECMHNPDFNIDSFVEIKNNLDTNAKKNNLNNWVKNTHAIGIKAVKGKNGGTSIHKDILEAAISCQVSCCIEILTKERDKLILERDNQPG